MSGGMMGRLDRTRKVPSKLIEVTPRGQTCELTPMHIRADAVVAVRTSENGETIVEYEVGREARQVRVMGHRADIVSLVVDGCQQI